MRHYRTAPIKSTRVGIARRLGEFPNHPPPPRLRMLFDPRRRKGKPARPNRGAMKTPNNPGDRTDESEEQVAPSER